LVSFYLPWEALLKVMGFLESRTMQWPGHWLQIECDTPNFNPINIATADDETPTPKPLTFDEKVCRLSWEQMFDLTLAKRDGFDWNWNSPFLQATVPIIKRSDLTGIYAITIVGT
jgi:hypothetical protein